MIDGAMHHIPLDIGIAVVRMGSASMKETSSTINFALKMQEDLQK
jgi:hypothetical protein